MKKNSLFKILGLLVLGVMSLSCSNSSTSANVDSNMSKAVDISEFIKGYDASDEALGRLDQAEHDYLVVDSLASPLGNPQGLCSLTSWWMDPFEDSDATSVNELIRFYNASALNNSIWADYEIWARAQMSGFSQPLVSTDSILYAIKNIDTSRLCKEDRKAADEYSAEMVWLITHPDDWSEERMAGVANNEFRDKTMGAILESTVDTVVANAYYAKQDSLVGAYESVQKQIEALEEDKRFPEILRRVSSAKSFDEQCAIVLACSSKHDTFSGAWTLKLMRELMSANRYSILLERMWMVWRAFSQQNYCGLSRDSYIPNYSYDKMRKTVFKTIIDKAVQNPSDKMVKAQAIYLSLHMGLIRNGSFIMGNDCAIDIINYCPGFYE